MRLNRPQKALLEAMSRGGLLRSHRELDGAKAFRLHQAGGQWTPVNRDDVHVLRGRGLIDSNKKFPVATFWLTEAGQDHLKSAS